MFTVGGSVFTARGAPKQGRVTHKMVLGTIFLGGIVSVSTDFCEKRDLKSVSQCPFKGKLTQGVFNGSIPKVRITPPPRPFWFIIVLHFFRVMIFDKKKYLFLIKVLHLIFKSVKSVKDTNFVYSAFQKIIFLPLFFFLQKIHFLVGRVDISARYSSFFMPPPP